MSYIITRNGRKFRVTMERDDNMGAPWDEHDGHGSVTGWTTRDKMPGERVLASDMQSFRYYNYAEAIKTAKHDGWDLGDKEMAALAQRLGRKPTAKEIRAETVERDFQYLRDWCNDEWEWVYVHVVMPDEDGEDTKYQASLGGIDGYGEYANECVSDLINQLQAELDEDGRKEMLARIKEKQARSEASASAGANEESEAREAMFWANMDLVTVR